MTEEENERPDLRSFEWKRNPAAPTFYGNYIHLGWTLEDVRITFGAIRSRAINSDEEDAFAEEQGSAVMSFRQAKNLRDMLHRLIVGYESANGAIVAGKLAQAIPPASTIDTEEEM